SADLERGRRHGAIADTAARSIRAGRSHFRAGRFPVTGSAALSSFVPSPADDLVELTTLFDVSQALGGFTSLHDGLRHVMALLRRHPGAIRGALTLLDAETGELYIESSLD